MHCGGCGRTVPAILRRCQYCGGAPVEAEQPRERHLVCPGCKGAMSEAKVGSLLIDHCGACGGVWYDRGELEQAIEAEKAQAQPLWAHLPGPDPRDAKVVYRNCPICRQAMHRKKKGPVIIELCGPHGAFLDAGELEQIAQHEEPEVVTTRKRKQPVKRDAIVGDESFTESITGAIAIDLAAEVIASVFFDW